MAKGFAVPVDMNGRRHILPGATTILAIVLAASCGKQSESVVTGPPGTGGTGTGSGPSGNGAENGWENLPGGGEVLTSTIGQPEGDLHSVCEYGHAWRLHSHHGQNVSVVPQRQYITSCNDGATTRVFVSMAVANADGRTQYVYEATLDDSTGTFTRTASLPMDQCEDSSGIAAAPDCSSVGILCHRPYGSSDQEAVDADLITPWVGDATGEKSWVLRGDNQANADTNTEMWLYEFPSADLAATPQTFLVHKAVRATNTARPAGQYYLQFGEAQNSYAMALRASMFTDGGARHVADSFLVIRRGATVGDWHIAQDRGYPWACGQGHTDYNHPVYNPISNQFALTCRTDIGGNLYFRTDTMGKPDPFFSVQKCCGAIGGGSTTTAAHPDGGFLVAMTAHEPTRLAQDLAAWESDDYVHPNDVWGALSPTSIAVQRFDASGDPTGDPTWIVHSDTHYLGHPQIIALDEDRYLLGWSEQYQLGDVGDDVKEIWTARRRHSFQSAWAYYVMEIDVEGEPLTAPLHIQGAGWGDFDEWTNLGQGRVAWSYIADPELLAWDDAAACGESATPALFMYTAQ